MASFSCNAGYSLSGSGSSICQTAGGGTWNEPTPTCIPGDEMILIFYLVLSNNDDPTVMYISWQIESQIRYLYLLIHLGLVS